MPGILGIISPRKRGDEVEKIALMQETMRHESFYDQGTFEAPEVGAWLGFTVIRGSFAHGMPFQNERRDVSLLFTGECYWDGDERTRLRAKGHEIGPGQGEVLVHLYEEMGEDLFRHLNGWYNGFLVDHERERAFLFNDRMSVRRVYLHQDEDRLVFSSEAKAILKAFPATKALNTHCTAEYLVYDCVLEDRTLFEGVKLLPPASAWKVVGGEVFKGKFFDISEWESQEPIPRDNYRKDLKETFRRVLPRYFSPGETGLSITGGLDTRMILAVRDPSPGELPCYTFTFSGNRKFWDARIAPKVARLSGQSHTLLSLDRDSFLREYHNHVERSIWITDGLEDVDRADVILFNGLAREVAPVRMTGKYGSQVLKDVFGFKERPPAAAVMNGDFTPEFDRAVETCRNIPRDNKLSFLLQKEIPWWWNGFVVSESSQVAVRSPFLDNDLLKLFYRMPEMSSELGAGFQIEFIGEENPALLSLPTTGTHGGTTPIISPLRKSFIKYSIMADKVFVRERIPYGLTSAVGYVDSLLTPIGLQRFLGYTDHRRYRLWYRKQLSGFLRDVLLSEQALSRPYWNRGGLRKAVEDHVSGRRICYREIRKALQLEMIHRILLERDF